MAAATFVKGEYWYMGPDTFGPRRRVYDTIAIAKRLRVDYRSLDVDTGRPWKRIPRCSCTHTVLEHRNDGPWTCKKCACRQYAGDDV